MTRFWKMWRQQINWRESLHQIFTRPANEDPIIDGLRGIASLSIILFHSFYGVMFLLKDFDRIVTFLNQIPAALVFLTNTDKAVDLFFTVSGYLMGGALFREMDRSGTINIKSFYLKRIFRIYPLFLVGIIFYGLGSPVNSIKNLIFNLLFIDNFTMKTIIPVGWSLSIEMQFYLVLPFLVFGLWKLRPSSRTIALLTLFLSSFAVILITMIQFPVTYQTPMYQFHPSVVDPAKFLDVVYYQTHTRYGPLILGLIWAWLQFNHPKEAATKHILSRLKRTSGWIAAVCGLILAVGCISFPDYRPSSPQNTEFSPLSNLTFHVLHRGLFVLGVLLTVLYAQRHDGVFARLTRRFLGSNFWRPFSQLVFPIYLFHFPMVAIAGVITLQTINPAAVMTVSMAQLFIIFSLAALLSLILGVFLHVLVEAPAIKIGAQLRRRSKHQV